MFSYRSLIPILAFFVCQACQGKAPQDSTASKKVETPKAKPAPVKEKKAQPAEKSFTLALKGIENQKPIDAQFAFCVKDGKGKATFGKNISPELSWSNAPAGTKSFAVVVHDPDVPTKADNVNKEGKTVSKDLKRMDFYHWVLVDLPANTTQLAQGIEGEGVKVGGKALKDAKLGRRGVNMYTNWFAGDEKMKGIYSGYDGPCPPWNDEIVHHYHFTVYALDVEKLEVKDQFGGADAVKAMQGHILGQASQVGLYALNPAVKY